MHWFWSYTASQLLFLFFSDWATSQRCLSKQTLRQNLHLYLEEIQWSALWPITSITLPILFFSACKWGCQQLHVLSVVLSTFNMFEDSLPGIAVKLLSLRYKISHNAIILSETLNSNPDAHATYVQQVLLWATLSKMGEVLSWIASLSAFYFTVTPKARIPR